MKKKISSFSVAGLEFKSSSKQDDLHEELSVLEDFSYKMTETLKNFEIVIKDLNITNKHEDWFHVELVTDEIYTSPVETSRQKGKLVEWKEEYKLPLYFSQSDLDINVFQKDEKIVSFKVNLDIEDKTHTFTHNNLTLSFKMSLIRLNTKKLLLHYDFQGSMKLIVRDKSLNNIKGELKHLQSGYLEQTEGRKKDEKAIRLSGFNYIECVSNPIKDIADFSISIWFKIADPKIDGVLLSSLENKSGIMITFYHTIFYDMKGNKIQPIKEELETDTSLRNEVFKRDDWNNKIIIYNGKYLNEYLNGKLINQMKCLQYPVSEGKKLTVGASIDGMDFCGFKGEIANLKIFNFSLTEKDIEIIQNE